MLSALQLEGAVLKASLVGSASHCEVVGSKKLAIARPIGNITLSVLIIAAALTFYLSFLAMTVHQAIRSSYSIYVQA